MINEHIHKIPTYSMKAGKSTWYGKNKKKIIKEQRKFKLCGGISFYYYKIKGSFKHSADIMYSITDKMEKDGICVFR